MKVFLQLALCGCLAAGVATAQRGGGHAGGGGGHVSGGGGHVGGGGGMRSGASFSGGFSGGGFRGGGVGFSGGGFRGGNAGFRGGFGGFRGGFGGFRGGFGRPFGFRSSFGFFPSYGFGYSYWPGYYDYGYPYDYSYPSYAYPASTYPAYQPSSNVTVVYPQTQAAPAYADRANPNLRQYDEYGQEIRQPSAAQNSPMPAGGNGSPLYLLAFRDQSIRAAVAYWVDGRTLHYVTQQHEERQAALDSIDRDLTLRLNYERHVPFSLPAPQ
jgi:hypothetical protein